MNCLSQLTEDEIRYICSIIPIEEVKSYFVKYPKEFSKIKPGFRPTSFKDPKQVSGLLFEYRSHDFISSFIEKRISKWLVQIQEYLTKKMDTCNDRDLALLYTLPLSFFSGNIALYFKLASEDHPEKYIIFMAAAVSIIKEKIDEQEGLKDELESRKSDIKRLQQILDSVKSDKQKTETKLNACTLEIKTLKQKIKEHEVLKATLQENNKRMAIIESSVKEQERIIHKLKTELSSEKKRHQQVEIQTKMIIEKQQTIKPINLKTPYKPRCPNDLAEFKEFLGYNFEDLGVSLSADYCSLLKNHIGKIIFQGIPVIVNRQVSIMLMKCIANALIGQQNVKTFSFNKDYSIEKIYDFFSSDERIVCLDNFLGNINETELLPLFDMFKNKIIFLTVAYDRTIYYISEEFLRYSHYLNLNRIAALTINSGLGEDPSKIDEEEIELKNVFQTNSYSSRLKKIMFELGIKRNLIEQKCASIFDENDLCGALAFDILPYSVDVLQILPYNTSEYFNEYAGDTGRCPYKKLFMEWFS